MCLTSISGSRRAGSVTDPSTRGLQAFTAALWDSVARIADGEAPDGEDTAVLEYARQALVGQAELLNYVESRAASAFTAHTTKGAENLVDLIWQAAEQLEIEPIRRSNGHVGIETLAGDLKKIGNGDRELATRYDSLLHHVATLTARVVG